MNNPLKQYFRRPALFINLPSQGKYYPAGAIDMPDNGELPVYPMTAIDEITAKTPDALFNGNAVIDIIKSCVPAIRDPWALPATDLDTILIGIRAATNGNELEIETTCTSCEETSKYGLNLVQMLSTIDASGYTEELQIGELKFKFRPLTYKQVNKGNLNQFELQREIAQLQAIEDDNERAKKSIETMTKLTNMNIELLSNAIASIELPNESVTNSQYIDEYLRGCDKNTHETIRKHVVKIREMTQIKPFKIKCIHCSHEYDQTLGLNISDFFE